MAVWVSRRSIHWLILCTGSTPKNHARIIWSRVAPRVRPTAERGAHGEPCAEHHARAEPCAYRDDDDARSDPSAYPDATTDSCDAGTYCSTYRIAYQVDDVDAYAAADTGPVCVPGSLVLARADYDASALVLARPHRGPDS